MGQNSQGEAADTKMLMELEQTVTARVVLALLSSWTGLSYRLGDGSYLTEQVCNLIEREDWMAIKELVQSEVSMSVTNYALQQLQAMIGPMVQGAVQQEMQRYRVVVSENSSSANPGWRYNPTSTTGY